MITKQRVEAEHHGRENMVEHGSIFHGGHEVKRERERWTRTKDILQRHTFITSSSN
jgi:hypothetical protein